MGTGDKGLQVGNSSVTGIGLLEVGGSIGAIDASATGINRHEPYDVNAQRPQFLQFGLGSHKSSLIGEGAHVHLIDDTAALCSFSSVIIDVIDIVGKERTTDDENEKSKYQSIHI
jgi:hypothetical protein